MRSEYRIIQVQEDQYIIQVLWKWGFIKIWNDYTIPCGVGQDNTDRRIEYFDSIGEANYRINCLITKREREARRKAFKPRIVQTYEQMNNFLIQFIYLTIRAASTY